MRFNQKEDWMKSEGIKPEKSGLKGKDPDGKETMPKRTSKNSWKSFLSIVK